MRQLSAIYFIVILIGLLVALALVVHFYGTLTFDISISRALQSHHGPQLDRLMEAISSFGSAWALGIVAMLVAGYLVSLRKNVSALLALASLISSPLNVVMKNMVDRARPTSALIKIISPAGGYSFPSGHAMTTMTVYGALAYLIWVNSQTAYRSLVVVAASVIILLVGVSRIYLGVHWFTDVLGGWIAGSILLLILVQLQKVWLEKNKIVSAATNQPN